jgi:hypothetical protein
MDLREIFRNDKLLQFWPSSRQSAKDRIASTVRFVLYASVIVYLMTSDPRVIILAGLVIGTLYVLNQGGMVADGNVRAAFGDDRIFGGVTMPTSDNPWMNTLMADDRDRPPSAFYPTVRKDVQSIWDKIHPFARQKDAMRNFYTVPENDQTAFAQSAHGVPFSPMCRDTPGMCNPDKMFYGRGLEQYQMRAGFGQGGNGRASGSA